MLPFLKTHEVFADPQKLAPELSPVYMATPDIVTNKIMQKKGNDRIRNRRHLERSNLVWLGQEELWSFPSSSWTKFVGLFTRDHNSPPFPLSPPLARTISTIESIDQTQGFDTYLHHPFLLANFFLVKILWTFSKTEGNLAGNFAVLSAKRKTENVGHRILYSLFLSFNHPNCKTQQF